MADYDDYDNDEQDEDSGPKGLRRRLKEVEAENRSLKPLMDENTGLKQKLALAQAGISLNDTQVKALAAVHSGEWNPEAVKQTATTLGYVQAPAPTPVVDDPNLATIDQIAAASAGTDPVPASRDAELDAALSKATSPEEFMALYRASDRPIAQ